MSLFACPKCKHPISRVLKTEEDEDGTVLRRRRRCNNRECDYRWSTEERETKPTYSQYLGFLRQATSSLD